jgi:FkbM family methyltransferase
VSFREIVKDASLSFGFYRQARIIYRYTHKQAMDLYLEDKKNYSQLLPPDSVLCFDVGANAGRISEILLELGHRVVAFEPQLQCVREVKARCAPYKQRLQLLQTALGDTPGTAELFVNKSSVRTSLDANWEQDAVVRTVQVPMTTLDSAIQRFGVPQYCKIDVEGWELHVLKGLHQPIPLISFEYHQDEGRMQDAYACLDYLNRLIEITVNVASNEKTELVLDEWLKLAMFKDLFEKDIKNRDGFSYGDIYVRMR